MKQASKNNISILVHPIQFEASLELTGTWSDDGNCRDTVKRQVKRNIQSDPHLSFWSTHPLDTLIYDESCVGCCLKLACLVHGNQVSLEIRTSHSQPLLTKARQENSNDEIMVICMHNIVAQRECIKAYLKMLS